MSFQWKERYALGIGEIDRQHKKLFEIGARLFDIASTSSSVDYYDQIIELVDELLDYTEYHFNYEEDLMKKYNYNGFEQQIHEHSYYIQKMKNTSSKKIEIDQKKSTLELIDFLAEWISSHIVFSDRKYADYFKENGIEL